MVEPGIIMGGSPSTGSSVLVNILNRHSALCAGPETYLFMHPKLYRDWATYAPALQRRRLLNHLCSEGWFVLHGAILGNSFYQWNPQEVTALARNSKTLAEFAACYFARAREAQGAERWVEKSPSNVVAFPQFLDSFPQGQVVHTVRNPLDTLASLHRRGLSAYYAAGAYLCNNSLALRCQNHPRYIQVHYEALVDKPQETLASLLQFLGLPWENGLLETEAVEVRMEGWKNQEHGQLSNRSVGSFYELSEETQEILLAALHQFEFSDAFRDYHKVPLQRGEDVIKALGFTLPKVDSQRFIKTLQAQQKADRWHRQRKLYPSGFGLYPAQLL